MSKKKHVRKIIGNAPQSYGKGRQQKRAQAYPFDMYGEVADLGFADQLLLSPEIDEEMKQFIRESFIIDATPVSDYFYEGTDQEYWDIATDFPNVAPPYERFFLEFKAPAKIVSRENGETPWQSERPIAWGLLCDGVEMADLKRLLTDEKERAEAIVASQKLLKALQRSINSIFEQYPPVKSQEDCERIYQSLKPADQQLLHQYRASENFCDLLTSGQLDKLKELSEDALAHARWALHMLLFFKFQSGDVFTCVGPFWHFQASVKHDGEIPIGKNGTMHVSHNSLGNASKRILQYSEETRRPMIHILEEMRDSIASYINTALLTLSFLHCKNVAVRTLEPTTLCHPSMKQQLTYHTLDIAPMRQVLRTEGEEQKTGTKKAMHICRGHFAHYENGRGLFGKYKGTFWIPQHIRGQTSLAMSTIAL